jgi:hypothetical protein
VDGGLTEGAQPDQPDGFATVEGDKRSRPGARRDVGEVGRAVLLAVGLGQLVEQREDIGVLRVALNDHDAVSALCNLSTSARGKAT